MSRKRILVVGMLDSIHTSRWLKQFKDQEIDFLIFPSKKFKNVHWNLQELMALQNKASFKFATFSPSNSLHGYWDYFHKVFLARLFQSNFRLNSLRRIVADKDFTYIHALEIQGAGYLVDTALKSIDLKFKFILTNWGSDIYYFQQFSGDRLKIISALQSATHYSGECKRDYELARNLGFRGEELPCIPNAGGFVIESLDAAVKTSKRLKIAAKTYGGTFGRGDLVIEALLSVMQKYSQISVHLYSVTEDLIENAVALQGFFPNRVTFTSTQNSLSPEEMKELFHESRIYMGASRSDGVSTSFLEALVAGCYPIQTNTSCASEWTKLGAVASIVPLEINQIIQQIEKAICDDELVDRAQIANREIASKYLNYEFVQNQAFAFYK